MKDAAENGKPKVGTFIQNFGAVFGELARRTTLGEGKYAPMDWRGRDDQYFIEKLSRHWVDFCENQDSIDEDGLPNISAVCFHALCLMYKYEERIHANKTPESTGTKEVLPNEPLSEYAWAAETFMPFDAKEYANNRHKQYPSDQRNESITMFQMYEEYLASFERSEGDQHGSSVKLTDVAIDSRGEVPKLSFCEWMRKNHYQQSKLDHAWVTLNNCDRLSLAGVEELYLKYLND